MCGMEEVFFLVCIVELIIQIISVFKLKKLGDSKYWNIFIGITLASFISTIIAYSIFAINALDLSDAISALFVCGFSFISNVIILIVGLIFKKTLKTNSVKINKNSFFVSILVILLNIFVLFCLPLGKTNVTLNSGEKQVIDYLNNKYGNGNYKVINVYNEYSNSGMWDKNLSGYYYEIKSDYMNDTFIVNIDDNFNYIDADYFLPVYYSQKNNLKYNLEYDDWSSLVDSDFSEFDNYINKILNDQYSVETDKIDISGIYRNYVSSWNNNSGVEYNSNYYIVPVNNGKIPTIQELVASLIKNNK